MGRILFWVLLGLAAYALWRWFSIKQRAHERASRRPPTPASERMVSCDVCHLNVPQSEALAARGRWYCCDEHRRRADG
jgi:uncharacterized protein